MAGSKGRHSGPPRPSGRRNQPARREPKNFSTTRELGGDIVAGRQAVRELLRARRRTVRDIWMVDGLEDAPIIGEIEAMAVERNIPIRSMGRSRLEVEAKTEAPQGVLAHAAPLNEVDLESLTKPTGGRVPFLVVLDGVTDPHNVGAILRSALCAGVTGIVLPRHRSAHITPTVAKAAAGAIEHLPIAVEPGIPAALEKLSDKGIWTVGLDSDGDTPISEVKVADQPIAIVMGAEGDGLSQLARKRCDVLAAIPLSGPLGSLNVSAAAAVTLYEISKHRP